MANQTAEFLELNRQALTAARGAISRQQAEIERRGDPDPDLTADAETLLTFIDEVNAVSPQQVADPSTDVPLPEVPVDLPTDGGQPAESLPQA